MSQLSDTTKYKCSELLNMFMFDKVWNEPSSEYRVNIEPILMSKQSVVGSITLLDGNLYLPDRTQRYFVYCINIEDFNTGLTFPNDEWTSTTELCNKWNTQISMYTNTGYMFSKSSVYFRYNESRNVIFIAVEKPMINKIGLSSEAVTNTNVYLTVYYDSDIVKNMKIYSNFLSSDLDMNNYQRGLDEFLATLTNRDHLQIYVNGLEYSEIPEFTFGDYVDYVIDENIVATFDIDVTYTSEDPTFLSDKDSTYKQLLHIPKSINPDNKVITHNTCDFFIRDRFEKNRGLYVHRAAGGRSVTQVTHNDMAMPLFIIDAYRDTLETQTVSIHCVIRIHEKDNYLVRDASFIDLLYSEQHTDIDIVKILIGEGPEEITWWKASELEKSKYVEMMFDIPNPIQTSNMTAYVEALGFYHTVNILCQKIMTVTLTDAFDYKVGVHLPVVYEGQVEPILYLNGRMLPFRFYSFKNNDLTCTITIDESIYTRPGDRLTIVFYNSNKTTIYEYIPDSTSQSTEIPYVNFSVYHKKKDVKVIPLQGVNTKYNDSYTKLIPGQNEYILHPSENGIYKVTFSTKYIGETMVIQNNDCSYRQTFDITDLTTVGENLVIPIESVTSGGIEKTPILNFNNQSVYINGNYLTENIEYHINTIRDGDDIYAHELVIQTMDGFVENVDDTVDVLFHVSEVEDLSNGFVMDDKLKDLTPVNLYFPHITTVHIDGTLELDINNKSVFMEIPQGKYHSGSVFEIQTSIPENVKQFVLEYAENQDYERIEILNKYFYNFMIPDPEVIFLERKLRLYSVYLNTFITDVINNRIIVTDEPDVIRMQEFIKPYDYLKEMDLCFRELDQRFVDYYPSYANFEVSPETKRLIDRYVEIFMPKNETPTVEVTYEN